MLSPSINADNKEGKLWRLALVDWGKIDTVWQRRLPFCLWKVGEQDLLFHWLDAAVDQGVQRIQLYVADRSNEVRAHIEERTLWPLQIEVIPVHSLEGLQVDDCIDRLPSTPPLTDPPQDGWALILHWHQLEMSWLDQFARETEKYGEFAAIGKNCELADDVEFTAPYWIGDFVSIGPGCKIGPGVVIEDGCILSGGSHLQRAHLGEHTYLGPEIDLIQAAIHRNELLNFKHRARIHNLDTFVASAVTAKRLPFEMNPPIRDRILAARLYLRWRKNKKPPNTTFTDWEGRKWPALAGTQPQDRGPWLKLVAQGKIELFGVTPRPANSLENLNAEWQLVLQHAKLGAFSYADLMGAPEIGSVEEALHCVYQASVESDQLRHVFDSWIEKIM